MAAAGERKLFLGGRLKRMRRDLGVTQARMAEDLGLSPSYLNLLERNQRPLTAQVLLRLAETYDFDLKSLSGEQEEAGAHDLGEVFADAMFRDLAVPRHEILEAAESAPALAEAVVRLYQRHLGDRRLIDLGGAGRPETGEGPTSATPSDWVRDLIQTHRNYFSELEDAAEALATALSAGLGAAGPGDFVVAARDRLLAAHGIDLRIAPREVLPDSLRRFDLHRRRLYLSEGLRATGRTFALAYHLAQLEAAETLEALAARFAPPDAPTRALLKVSLANYAAAALLAPYSAFHEAVESTGCDLDLVCARFGISYEQACHRLTTLAKPGQRGTPFFMLRVDCAGNVSKRFASGPFPFSRFGGACPRWSLHTAFKTPGRIVAQIVETPDGQQYFTFSRTVRRAAAAYTREDADLAVGMGCELKYAGKLIYAAGLDLQNPAATGIGPACRICERPACPQRAAEPISRTLMVDDFTKSISPYPFAPGG